MHPYTTHTSEHEREADALQIFARDIPPISPIHIPLRNRNLLSETLTKAAVSRAIHAALRNSYYIHIHTYIYASASFLFFLAFVLHPPASENIMEERKTLRPVFRPFLPPSATFFFFFFWYIMQESRVHRCMHLDASPQNSRNRSLSLVHIPVTELFRAHTCFFPVRVYVDARKRDRRGKKYCSEAF